MTSSRQEHFTERALGILLLLLSIGTIAYYAQGAWSYFVNICPNTDVLTWDENIRLNTVYDQYSDFQNGRIFSGILPFLESPTWPPLRSFITLGLAVFSGSTAVTVLDSFVGLGFLLATFISIFWICWKVTGRFLYVGIFSLSATTLVLQTIEVSAYSLSSMLETQSMFFLVWCYYFLYRLYQNPQQPKRTVVWGTTISLLAFFFTKYPYGLMLFMATIALEIAKKPSSFWTLIRYAFSTHYRGIRRILLILVILLVFSLPFLRLLSDVNLNQRAFKLFLYYISLPVFLDLQYFIWKHRNRLKELCPTTLQIVYLGGFLPALAWIYSNPDRVSSLVDAQMIVNHFTKSFFLSLVAEPSGDLHLPMAVFDSPWGIRILLAGAFCSLSIWFYPTWKELIANRFQNFTEHLTRKLSDPLYGITVVLFLQLLILETTTGNKQQRHVLQFLPGLTLILWLWLFRGCEYRPQFTIVARRIYAKTWDLLLGIVFLGTILLLVKSTGLWAGGFFDNRHFCLRGEDGSVFEPARWLDNQLPKDKNLLLFNGFHESFNYDKPGRLIASEIDLKIRQSRYKQVVVRHDNRHKWKSWENFDELVWISDSCDDPEFSAKLDQRKIAVGAELELLETKLYPGGNYCLKRFAIFP